MKRYAVPALAGVLVFTAVTGFAATLDVTSTTLGSGEEVVSSCNASAAVSYTSGWDAALQAYEVTTAPVTSAATCGGMAYKVTLTDSTGASLGEEVGTLGVDGTAVPSFAADQVLAENVTGVSVVITGALPVIAP